MALIKNLMILTFNIYTLSFTYWFLNTKNLEKVNDKKVNFY